MQKRVFDRSRTILVTCAATVLAAVSFSSGQDATEKRPVPPDAAQAESTKLIKEVYGGEWAAAKTPAGKQALAKKLLGKASESKDDPASQFVLLRLTRDIATQLGDGQTAYQAIDAMAETFQVDVLGMKMTVLTKCASAAQYPPQHKAIVEEALKLLDQAVSQDNFTVTDEFGKFALAEARKALNRKLLSQAQGRVAEVTGLAKAYEEVKTARVKLQKTPDDAEANLVVGKHLCFVKGEWDKGLPMLAFGKDEALKALAAKEQAGVSSSAEQAKLGDGWWDVAEKQEGTAKRQTQAHAGYWYQQALPGLSGLTKDKVQKRVEAEKEDAARLGERLTVVAGKSPAMPNGWVKVVNRKSGLILWWDRPKRIEPAGDYFKIREERGGYIALAKRSMKNAGPMLQLLCVVQGSDDPSMFWKIEPRGDGFWTLTNKQSGKSLEVPEPNPGHVVRQSSFRPKDPTQEWRFEPVKPSE